MDLNKIFMKNASPTKVGGQAILEGLMMRGSRAIAIANREPAGGIHLSVEPLGKPSKWKKVPIVRGVVSFIDSIVTGTSILLYSAELLEELEKTQGVGEGGSFTEEPDKLEIWLNEKFGEEKANTIFLYISVVLSILLTVGMFILLPTFLIGLLRGVGLKSVLLLNLLEGVIRITIFIAYVWLIAKMPDIKRVFQYHGAEHKTIHCYENKLELTPENAQSFYTLHPRCGTSFMMFVMVISFLVHSFFGWPGVVMRVASRLLVLPVVAGLSYELLQFTGRHDNALVKALSLPGIYLQKITTAQPSLRQLEVAIVAMKAVLPSQENPDLPVEYWVGTVTPEGEYIKDEAATEAYRAKKEKK